MKTLLARITPAALGALFIYSALYKVLYPGEVTYAIMSLDKLHSLATPSIVITTGLELYLGIILLLKVDIVYGLRASTILMLFFTGFLWYLSTLAHPPHCGCMGLTGIFKSTKHAALFGLIRNCLILWCLKLSIDYYDETRKENNTLREDLQSLQTE